VVDLIDIKEENVNLSEMSIWPRDSFYFVVFCISANEKTKQYPNAWCPFPFVHSIY